MYFYPGKVLYKEFLSIFCATSVIAVLMVVDLIGDSNDGATSLEIKAPNRGCCKSQLYHEHSDSHTVWLSLLP